MFPVYKLLVCLVMTAYSTAQTITPHTICNDDTVTVKPGSSGYIQHIQNTLSSTGCTLILRGFNNDSYISITGVDNSNCTVQPFITINGKDYCVNEIILITRQS